MGQFHLKSNSAATVNFAENFLHNTITRYCRTTMPLHFAVADLSDLVSTKSTDGTPAYVLLSEKYCNGSLASVARTCASFSAHPTSVSVSRMAIRRTAVQCLLACHSCVIWFSIPVTESDTEKAGYRAISWVVRLACL